MNDFKVIETIDANGVKIVVVVSKVKKYND